MATGKKLSGLTTIESLEDDDLIYVVRPSEWAGERSKGITKQDFVSGITGAGAVDSVNTQTGAVVLDADDIDDSATTNKFTTAGDISKLSGIEANAKDDQTGAEIKALYEAEADTNAFTDAEKTSLANKLDSVVGGTNVTIDNTDPNNPIINASGGGGGGDMLAANNLSDLTNTTTARTNLGVDVAGTDNSTDVTLAGTGTYISIAGQVITVDPITESDISDLGTYSTDIHGNIAALDNVSGTNTGDQTSIVGITGTKAQFDTAVTDGNIMYVGDAPTSHTHTASEVTDFDTEVANNTTVAQNVSDISDLQAGLLTDSSTIITSRDMVATDADGINNSTATSDVTITIVDNATEPLAVGSILQYKRSDTGNVILTAGAGVTITTKQTYALDDVLTIRKTATDTWEYFNPSVDFDSKQDNITLTTTGTSGAATLIGDTLNIPQYTGGGGGDMSASTYDPATISEQLVGLTASQTLTNKTLTSPILTTPTLGTPTSGTLTNATGLPIVAGTTGTLSVARGGTGATTLTGILKGNGTGAVTAVTAPTGTILGTTDTQTLTNKRVTKRVNTITSSATPTPSGDTTDVFTVTALAANATFAAPTGTPTAGQELLIRIKDNATARTLAWNAIYRASTDFALPTTTVISKTMYIQFIYNATDSKWDAVGLTQGF